MEVIDLRTLRPLDVGLYSASVAKTSWLLVVEEGPRTGGWAGEVLASVVERASIIWTTAGGGDADLPLPYSPPLEDAFLPGPEAIVESVRAHLS